MILSFFFGMISMQYVLIKLFTLLYSSGKEEKKKKKTSSLDQIQTVKTYKSIPLRSRTD
uniref:Uncharacterized protein n=1 Tax=Rhizophora mucronata TaxID=61149 RepID=A0A2P2NIC2_RHIMU